MADIPDIAKTEAVIIEQTNAFRRAQGLGTVAIDPKLMRAARRFAVYLAKTGNLSHEADGRGPAQRATAAGYPSCWISENLAFRRDSKGFTANALASSAMDGWKNSSAHRTNLLAREMIHIGVGIARAPDEPTKYLAVQMFGNSGKKARGCRSGSLIEVEANRLADTMHGRAPSGDVPTALRLDARYQARDGTLYTVAEGLDGKVRVDVGQAR